MKRRLSDADELTFWHLALHSERRDTYRPNLMYVHVHDGRAWASDSYRMLTAPVEAEWSGRVAVGDALAGGTVEVLPLDPKFGPQAMDGICVPKQPHHHKDTLTLSHAAVERLRPWCERKVAYADRGLSPTIAELAPRWLLGEHSPLRLPDGEVVGQVTGGYGDHLNRGPVAVVQAPYLARAVCSVADLGTAGVVVSGQPGSPLVVTPVDSFDVVALVMPIHTPNGWLHTDRGDR